MGDGHMVTVTVCEKGIFNPQSVTDFLLSASSVNTPIIFCSLCLEVCSLSGSHNQMRLTVATKTHYCCLTCVRATFSRTKKSAGWLGLVIGDSTSYRLSFYR
jgi:hypothetical protein